MRTKICALLSIILLQTATLEAQTDAGVKAMLTADSLSSGNYKDVLTSFFHLALNDLTGPDKELGFSANVFAIMMKGNPKLDVDTNYIKHTAARNTNIEFDVKLNNNSQFDGFSFGIKHALINRRDYTIAHSFIPLVLEREKGFSDLYDTIIHRLSRETINDHALRRRCSVQIDSFFSDDTTYLYTLDRLDPFAQGLITDAITEAHLFNADEIANNQHFSIRRAIDEKYNDVKNSFQNKPLWVVGLKGQTYTDKFQLSNVDLSTEFLKGIINPKASSNLELDIKGDLNIQNDSTKTTRNLGRDVASGEAGVNWVIKGMGNTGSNFEFKLTASETYIMSGLLPTEKAQLFTLNGTLRVRITGDLWIPIEFKYDPVSGNVFGLLNVTSNFTWLKNRVN